MEKGGLTDVGWERWGSKKKPMVIFKPEKYMCFI